MPSYGAGNSGKSLLMPSGGTGGGAAMQPQLSPVGRVVADSLKRSIKIRDKGGVRN